MDLFDRAFWQQFVVTVLSIAIGIPVGFWITGWGHRKEKERQQQDDTDRRHQLLRGLKDSVAHNRKLLGSFIDDSDPESEAEMVLMDHVDLTFLDATAALKYEVLRDDVELASEVDKFRAQLREIELGLNLYNQAIYDLASRGMKAGEASAPDAAADVTQLVSLFMHVRRGTGMKATECRASGEALLKKIDEALTPAEMRAPRREAVPMR